MIVRSTARRTHQFAPDLKYYVIELKLFPASHSRSSASRTLGSGGGEVAVVVVAIVVVGLVWFGVVPCLAGCQQAVAPGAAVRACAVG